MTLKNDLLFVSALSLICLASSGSYAQQPPFYGARGFNFSGGNGTGLSVTIQKNGRMTVKSHGTSGEETQYDGPFQNPVKVFDGSVSYEFTAKEAILREDGEVAFGCLTEGKPCVSELYKIDGAELPNPPLASPVPEVGEFVVTKQKDRVLSDVTNVKIVSKFSNITIVDFSVNRENCTLLSYGSVIKKPIKPIDMKFGDTLVIGAGGFCNPMEVSITTRGGKYTVEFNR
ncbi:hypothetical protein [Azospirillum palustre]